MSRCISSLLLAALLLQPAAASAQAPAKNPPRKVSLQVTFVAVKTSDLEALGINFDLVPIPAPPASPKQFLAVAAGSSVTDSYRRLTQTAGVQSHFITPASAVVSDTVPATFAVHAQFTDPVPETMSNPGKSFPRLTSSSQIEGKTTFTPHIKAGNLISLDMDSPVGDGRTVHLNAVPSGQQIVINTAAVKVQEASRTSGNVPQIQSLERNLVSEAKELLIFVTPTIVTGAPGRGGSAAPEKAITFNMVNGDLQTAIVRVERQYGIQCIVQDSIDVHRTINISITNYPLSQVLQFLASAVDAQVTRNLDGVYIFTSKPAAAPKGPVSPVPPPQLKSGFGNSALLAEPFSYSVRFLHVHPPLIILPDLLLDRDPGNVQTKERVYGLD